MNNSMFIKEIEIILKILSTKKNSGPCDFTGKFHQIFKEEATSALQRPFQETGVEGMDWEPGCLV